MKTDGSAASESGYRAHLDGLRAIAVYLVVLFHAAATQVPGGFVGVDMFFVLSGYLVTQVLMRDVAQRGSIRFGRFYARRFRRLFPAACVTLISTAAVYAAIASPVETMDAIASFKAAFLYSANWYFILQSSSYFGVDVATNPVLHFWSLAVEEQFYLLWPLALAALVALSGRRVRGELTIVRVVVAIAALASVVRALWIRDLQPGWAYYGTDARAYQLLAGAVVALTPALVPALGRFRRTTRIVAVVAVLALLFVSSPLGEMDAISRGIAVTIATCALIVALEASDGGLVHGLLSSRFMVYLGKISYGTYLWHWPVLLLVARTPELGSLSPLVVDVVLATALASLSAAILEMPIRESRLLDRYGRIVVASGLATSVVAALVIIPAVMTPNVAAAVAIPQSVATVGTTLSPAQLDWRNARWPVGFAPNCEGQPVERCTIVKGTGRHVLLLGDSLAQAWIPTFTEIAKRENLTFSAATKGACPWQRDLFRPATVFLGMPVRPEDCKKFKDDVYDRVIPQLKPDVIVVAQFPHEDPGQGIPFTGPDFIPLEHDTPAAFSRALEQATASSLAALRAGDTDVLIIEPIPIVPFKGRDPLSCISSAKALEECRYVVSTESSPLEEVYRAMAKRDTKVHAADFDRLICPYLPICDPVVNGQIVKFDKTHLTIPFAKSLADPVDLYMKTAGILPPTPNPPSGIASATKPAHIDSSARASRWRGFIRPNTAQ